MTDSARVTNDSFASLRQDLVLTIAPCCITGRAAIKQLLPEIGRLLKSADGAEGVQSFIERRDVVFTGR